MLTSLLTIARQKWTGSLEALLMLVSCTNGGEPSLLYVTRPLTGSSSTVTVSPVLNWSGHCLR